MASPRWERDKTDGEDEREGMFNPDMLASFLKRHLGDELLLEGKLENMAGELEGIRRPKRAKQSG